MAEIYGIAEFDDQVAALEGSLQGATALAAGFKMELERVGAVFVDINDDVSNLSSGMTSGLRKSLDGLVYGSMNVQDALKSLGQSILDTVYDTAVSPLTSGLGSLLGQGLGSVMNAFVPYAKGGAFSQGRVMPFANGGVVNGPVTFPMRGGTGLMGAELRGQADWLEGWDLSTRMLAEAEGKAIYDALDKRDIAALDLGGTRWDVIVAADVFAYVGALERVVGWCAGSLAPGGRLVFSVELSEAEPVVLRESRRFAHSRAYIAGLLAQAGFGEVALRQVVLRMDRGQPIQSLVVMASGLGVGRREGEGEAEAFA